MFQIELGSSSANLNNDLKVKLWQRTNIKKSASKDEFHFLHVRGPRSKSPKDKKTKLDTVQQVE